MHQTAQLVRVTGELGCAPYFFPLADIDLTAPIGDSIIWLVLSFAGSLGTSCEFFAARAQG